MKKTGYALILIVLLFPAALPAPALENVITDLSMGIDTIRGHTTYRIGGHVMLHDGSTYHLHFPVSELKFPLNLYMLTGRADIRMGEKLSAHLAGKINLNNDPGEIRDTDWLASPFATDIYSESQAEAEALMAETGIRYRMWRRRGMDVLAGLGCRYQDFAFEAGQTLQSYPASGASPDFLASRTLAYDITYLIPYAEIVLALSPAPKTAVEISLGYSPWIWATDRDHHILSNRISECDYDGDGIIVSMKTRQNISAHLFATLTCEVLAVDGEGRSVTYANGAWSHSIDQTTETRQISLELSAGYTF